MRYVGTAATGGVGLLKGIFKNLGIRVGCVALIFVIQRTSMKSDQSRKRKHCGNIYKNSKDRTIGTKILKNLKTEMVISTTKGHLLICSARDLFEEMVSKQGQTNKKIEDAEK